MTEKGETDAQRAGEILGKIAFDKVYTSDLIRAEKTAEIALGVTDYEKDPLLREVNLGSIGGKKIDTYSPEERKAFWKNGYASYGGETNEQFRERIAEFFKKAESFEYENVAVFSHSGWLRGALALVLESPLAKERVICNNCAIGVFEYKNGVWKLYSWTNV